MKSVEIAIPVYNEEEQLARSVTTLRNHLSHKRFRLYTMAVTLVNNGSTDETERIGGELCRRYENIRLENIPRKGRGNALMYCWGKSKAEILAYMDVDLSADIRFLKDLLDAVAEGGADLAVGSRLSEKSKVKGRTLTREVMSRGYNLLTKMMFNIHFSDAQCGFKALRREAFEILKPHIRNRNWFFDSELLILAEKAGFTIREIPIVWQDDPGSTVKVAKTASEDILGLLRLSKTQPWKQIKKQ